MTKATITIIRQGKVDRVVGAEAGKMVEALIHIAGTNNSIHAEDLKLRRIGRFILQPLNVSWVGAGSIVNTKAENNYASMTIGSLRAGGSVIVAGTIQNYYLLAIGE